MDIVYDVIIIGGGAAGVMTALELTANSHLTIAILEKAKRLNDARNIGYCWLGASARSYARITNSPSVGGVGFSDSEFTQYKEYMEHFLGQKLEFEHTDLKKKALNALKAADLTAKQFDYAIVPEDGFIKIADRMHMVLKPDINIYHKIEIVGIEKKQENSEEIFEITTEDKTYKARKLIIGTGRSSQTWFEELPKNFTIPYSEDEYEIGVRIEIPNVHVDKVLGKDFDSKIVFDDEALRDWKVTAPVKKMNIETEEIGDLKTSNTRQSNHGKKNYVSFAIMHTVKSKSAAKDVERLIGLSNVLGDYQLSREPTAKLMDDSSVLSPIPEFKLFKKPLAALGRLCPEILTKSMLYSPEAPLNIRKYEVETTGKTPVENFYMIGDMTGHQNSFTQAAISGIKAANHILGELTPGQKKKKEVYDYATIEAASKKKRSKDLETDV